MKLRSRSSLLSVTVCIVSCTSLLFGSPPDRRPPTPPSNLTTNNITCGSVGFSWSPSVDPPNGNDTISGVQGYTILRNGAFLQQVTTTSFSDSAVTVSATYVYGVSAVDNAGN